MQRRCAGVRSASLLRACEDPCVAERAALALVGASRSLNLMGGGAFGVARDFRETHGEAAFEDLVRFTFTSADADGSGNIDKTELRATLKKLGIRLTGQTAGVLAHYDTNQDGMIDEGEFLKLVSDLIDGTFESTLQPQLEEKMRQQQQQLLTTQKEQMGKLATEQQALVAEVKRLREELTKEKATNSTLREQIGNLKRQLRKAVSKRDEEDERKARDAKKAAEDAMVAAANEKILAKLNKFG